MCCWNSKIDRQQRVADKRDAVDAWMEAISLPERYARTQNPQVKSAVTESTAMMPANSYIGHPELTDAPSGLIEA